MCGPAQMRTPSHVQQLELTWHCGVRSSCRVEVCVWVWLLEEADARERHLKSCNVAVWATFYLDRCRCVAAAFFTHDEIAFFSKQASLHHYSRAFAEI